MYRSKNVPLKNCLYYYLFLFLSVSCQQQGPPHTPRQALDTFELADGYQLELIASEPLVRDPVDMAFDANGRLYVVEMPDYPAKAGAPPHSKIVLLEDRSGDGKYDTRTVFAKDLPYANGVMPWKEGILVTSAPNILYFEDTTGDGRADVRRVVLSGFAKTNPQLRVSNLRYGIDNWIYGAYFKAFGSGGDPQFTGKGEPLYFPESPGDTSFNIKPGMDFRFRPDDFNVERAGGRSQFGNAVDASGNRFTVMNADHIRHVVIPYRYAEQNPYLSMSTLMESISDHGKASRVYPITEDMLNFRTSADEVGHFTAACGTSIYTGALFPPPFAGAAFICDPAQNIVHADLLSPNGATFTAGRALQEKEFVGSTDSWFRPVNSKVGPDGGLYIVDMYRNLVEHPAFIPHSGRQVEGGGFETQVGVITEADFYKGQDLGRIYRIVPEEYNNKEQVPPQLKEASTRQLVSHLDHPNSWWRLTAQRLLVQRGGEAGVPVLGQKALDGRFAQGRMHSLWTLEGLGGLADSVVVKAMDDKNPMVRKQAVILSEPRLSNPAVQTKLAAMAADPHPHVQFQVALTLSKLPHTKSFTPLQEIASQHLDDAWFRTAVALSITDHSLAWFKRASEFATSSARAGQGKRELLGQIASIIGARECPGEISDLLSRIVQQNDSEYQRASLTGLQEGLAQAAGPPTLSPVGQRELMHLIRQTNPPVQTAALDLAEHITMVDSPALLAAVRQARATVSDENASTDAKVYATRVLGLDPKGLQISVFEQLLSLQQPTDVQKAAARVLVKERDPASVQLLLDRWDTYTSAIRNIVEQGFLDSRMLTISLMEAIQEGNIQPSWLSQQSRSVLTQHPDNNVREMAQKAFSSHSDAQRENIVSNYFEATRMDGDISNGRAIFEKTCSPCHQLGGVGYAVGPDLLSFSDRDKIALLRAIIVPNSDITPGYEGNVIQTTAGQTFSGIVAHESSNQIVLSTVGGGQQTVSRENIESVRPMSISLMPNGLEADMSRQEMADLLEYLKNVE